MGGSQLGSVQLQMFTGICAPKASREPITLSSLVCANCSQQQPQQLQQQQQPQCFRHYNSTIRSLLALSEWINQFFLLFFAFALFSGGLFSLITFTLTRKLPQQAARGASGADFQINRYTNMFNHTHISKHAVCTFFLLPFVVRLLLFSVTIAHCVRRLPRVGGQNLTGSGLWSGHGTLHATTNFYSAWWRHSLAFACYILGVVWVVCPDRFTPIPLQNCGACCNYPGLGLQQLPPIIESTKFSLNTISRHFTTSLNNVFH